MLPKSNLETGNTGKFTYPSHTYRLDTESKRITGRADGLAAIKQAIYKILLTERCAYLIYSFGYGASIEKYVGMDYDYIQTDIKREIRLALKQDDRIQAVKDFKIEKTKLDECSVSFTVETLEGDLSINRRVAI